MSSNYEVSNTGKESVAIISASAAGGAMIGSAVFPGPGTAIGAASAAIFASVVVICKSLSKK